MTWRLMWACVMPCWSAMIKMMVLTLAKGLNCALHKRGSLDSETDPPGARKGGNSRKCSRWKCQGFRGIWQNELEDTEMIWKFMWETWTLHSQWEHWTQGLESEAVHSLQGLVHWLTECRAQFTDPTGELTSPSHLFRRDNLTCHPTVILLDVS